MPAIGSKSEFSGFQDKNLCIECRVVVIILGWVGSYKTLWNTAKFCLTDIMYWKITFVYVTLTILVCQYQYYKVTQLTRLSSLHTPLSGSLDTVLTYWFSELGDIEIEE